LLKNRFFQQYIGKEVNDAFRMHRDIDNVTGASISSKSMNFAIADAIEYQVPMHLKEIGQNYTVEQKQSDKQQTPIKQTWFAALTQFHQLLKTEYYLPELLVAFLMFWALADVFVKKPLVRRFKPALPFFAVLILGFYLDSAISLSTLSGLLLGFYPEFRVFPLWWLLVGLVLLVLILFGKNIYCNRLCPFQALEAVLRKLTKVRYSIKPSLAKKAHKIALFLTWLALVVSFISVNPIVGSYEPFSAVFSLGGQGLELVILVCALLAIIFYPGFWCRVFCPVGICLEQGIKTRAKAKRKFDQKVVPQVIKFTPYKSG
jgi:hypothetical protein